MFVLEIVGGLIVLFRSHGRLFKKVVFVVWRWWIYLSLHVRIPNILFPTNFLNFCSFQRSCVLLSYFAWRTYFGQNVDFAVNCFGLDLDMFTLNMSSPAAWIYCSFQRSCVLLSLTLHGEHILGRMLTVLSIVLFWIWTCLLLICHLLPHGFWHCACTV